MPILRLCGGTSAIERSSSRMSPASGVRNPAIRLSVVVFPDPLGPSSETKAPAGTSSEMRSTACDAPNALVSWRRRSWAPLAIAAAANSVMHGGVLSRSDGAVRPGRDDPASDRKNQLPQQCRGLEGPAGCTHGDTDPADRDEARSSCYKHRNVWQTGETNVGSAGEAIERGCSRYAQPPAGTQCARRSCQGAAGIDLAGNRR